MTGVQAHVDAWRRQVQRILASQEFAGLRQRRDFLSYVSEAAFEGRTTIDQVEIAQRVLHRGKDFNPAGRRLGSEAGYHASTKAKALLRMCMGSVFQRAPLPETRTYDKGNFAEGEI